jgi:hypothetical protein
MRFPLIYLNLCTKFQRKTKENQWQVLCHYIWTAILIQYAKHDPHAKVCAIKLLADNVQPQVVQQFTDEQMVMTLIQPPYSPQYASCMLFRLFGLFISCRTPDITVHVIRGLLYTPYTQESVPRRACAMDTSSEIVCCCEGIVC